MLFNSQKLKNIFAVLKPERLIFGLALIIGGFLSWYIYHLGATTLLIDENSHLNLARQVIDSMTPGISQIGFWPPILHLIMIPFVAIDFLYQTGLAGAFILVPFLALATFFFCKLLFLFTKSRFISFFGAVIFLLNPYILYYSATPMMEVLFMANLFGTAYFLVQWLKTDKLSSLILSGMFVALASVSRFEGLILIPLIGFIILIKFLQQKKKYREIEALMILFSCVAVLGVLSILGYGLIFSDNPLAFLSGDWSAYSQQRDFFLPTEHNVFKSFQYLFHASYYMLGKPQIIIALISFIILLIFSPSFEFIAVSLILICPFIFDWLALFRGNSIIYVPELLPFNQFFNERYGLYWLGFVVLVPMVLAGMLLQFKKIRLVSTFAGIGLILFLVFLSSSFLYKTAYLGKFEIIKSSAQGYPSENQIDVARNLQKNYDFGKVLITRALHDFVTVNAGIPLKNYIHESNYRFYDQALERPWLFARWVVMYNPNTSISTNWSKKNEKVSVKWGESQTFLNYYDLILENDLERLYKTKEDAVRQYATERGFDLSKIPSLNSEITWWNPETIYQEMNALTFENVKEINIKLVKNGSAQSLNQSEKHIIQKGENLWIIAEKYYNTGLKWTDIAKDNNLVNPDLIYPQDILSIPNK